MDASTRQNLLVQLYDLLNSLERRTLDECSGRLSWPNRGVYFFFDPSQSRQDTGIGQRVVRVGTHALTSGSKTTLWKRLSQHKGTAKSGGGNHRGSIFRLLVGDALIRSQSIECPTWGIGNVASKGVRSTEGDVEREVSKYIGELPFVYVSIPDDPTPSSVRGVIERNSIALLSNSVKEPLDRLGKQWLGYESSRERVRQSELWNQNHVNEQSDPLFLAVLTECIESQRKCGL